MGFLHCRNVKSLKHRKTSDEKGEGRTCYFDDSRPLVVEAEIRSYRSDREHTTNAEGCPYRNVTFERNKNSKVKFEIWVRVEPVAVSLVEQRGFKDKMILYEGEVALLRRNQNVVLACDARGGCSLR